MNWISCSSASAAQVWTFFAIGGNFGYRRLEAECLTPACDRGSSTLNYSRSEEMQLLHCNLFALYKVLFTSKGAFISRDSASSLYPFLALNG
jgi:hypothetical protein